MTAAVCKPLRKLTSVKTNWAWIGMYQELYNKAKNLIKARHIHEILCHIKPPISGDKYIQYQPLEVVPYR